MEKSENWDKEKNWNENMRAVKDKYVSPSEVRHIHAA